MYISSREPLREFCPVLEDLSPVSASIPAAVPFSPPPTDGVAGSDLLEDVAGDNNLQFGKT